MKVFMTGATGYIGEQLAIALVKRQFEVVALVRSVHKATDLAAAGVKLVQGNLEDAEQITQAMQQCEAVFHLAAYARVWPEDEAIFSKVNVAGTRTIMEAALHNKVKKVIITSTASVYGPSLTPDAAVDESTTKTLPFFTPYETSKAAADQLAKSYTAKGIEVVILCPARVYGPGRESESNAINKLVALYLAGKWRFLPGNGKGVGSYCYIADVVEAYIQALSYGRSGESYLLGGDNATYEEFFRVLKQLTGKQYKLYKVPYQLLLWLSYVFVLVARVTPTTPLITPAWARKYRYNWQISSRKAINELHYKVTPLEEGLRKTLAYIIHEQRK